MPVDLGSIPPVAKRKMRPSLKRWALCLLFFLLCGGGITLKLWPTNMATQGAFFWHCLISIPLISWLVLFCSRWLTWLISESLAEGWDQERAADLAAEIQRGQRYLTLQAVNVRLPHVVASEALAEQFLLPQAITLPVVVNEESYSVVRYACFDDAGQPMLARVITLLSSLLDDVSLKNVLIQRKSSRNLAVCIQIDTDTPLSDEETFVVKRDIFQRCSMPSSVFFSPGFSLTEIDNKLDERNLNEDLLILSARLLHNPSEGDAEAAVALLFCSKHDKCNSAQCHARLHRPELSKTPTTLNESIEQALLWGKSHLDDVAYVWLAGLGTENNAQNFIANNNLTFANTDPPSAVIDIDMKSGGVGNVTPWLAIALAAGNSQKKSTSQLVMNMSDEKNLPWWFIVHPA